MENSFRSLASSFDPDHWDVISHPHLPDYMREPTLSHPLWTPPLPIGGACAMNACEHSSDDEAIREALSILQENGVVVLGPLDDCDHCGWGPTYRRLCFGYPPDRLTAVFWDKWDEYEAFAVKDAVSDVDGTVTRSWSPDIVLPFPLYWCGDVGVITQCLDMAALNFSTPRRTHQPFVIESLGDALGR